MSKITSNSRKKTESIGRRGRPRQARLNYSVPKEIEQEITKNDIEKLKQVIVEQNNNEVSDSCSVENNNQEIISNDSSREKELSNEIELLNQKIKILEETNTLLKSQLEKQNDLFLQKIQQKTEQAQKLLDEKIAFYENKKNEEVSKIKSSVFEDIASSFLDPIILLQSIINSSPADPIIANYLQGFKMLLNQFDEKLSDLGVDEINVNVGDPFNELYMEAFDVVEDNNFPPNTVVKIVKKGFVVNESKVLKHTLVIVSK